MRLFTCLAVGSAILLPLCCEFHTDSDGLTIDRPSGYNHPIDDTDIIRLGDPPSHSV